MEADNLRMETCDFNQNLIKPSRSLELSSTILNQLEKDSNIEIAECNRVDACVKHDTNLQPTLHQHSEQIEKRKDERRDKCAPTTITYEEIMSFLTTFEDESTQADNTTANSTTICTSYTNPNSRHDMPDGLIFRCHQQDELETATLQIEEKNATIECLKTQLKSERKAACDKIASQKRCHVTKTKELENKYRMIVKRHQKFIEQLINEKTDLTQKCDSLARQIKEMEQKVQRDLKVITERHAVELQRTKDNMAASEKIRRERWLEMKTSKIKEMTVKGLEPELHNMIEKHQQEIQELRRVHIKDLQDAELRAMRRSNQQLEQLRIELTDSHDKLLAKEKDILAARYREKLEEQETHFHMQQKMLTEHFEKEKSILIAEQKKRDEETNARMQQTQLHFQKEVDRLKEQQEIAKRNFEQSLQEEWRAWIDDYKKQQTANFARAETAIRDDCQKMRDKQIEIAIARLERETREIRDKLQQSFDKKFELMKEDYDTKLQSAFKSENIHKNKLLILEEKLQYTEIQFEKTKTKLKECMSNLNNMNEVITKLTADRDNAKEIAKQEIEAEKRELQDEIASLYQEIARNNDSKNQLVAQLYSRIKFVITQKSLAIKDLNKQLSNVNSKCNRLEKLVDHQRKEYILKNV